MYNPYSISYSLIPPCHNIIHIINIYKLNDEDIIDITTLNRSSDMILGLPMNMIFS